MTHAEREAIRARPDDLGAYARRQELIYADLLEMERKAIHLERRRRILDISISSGIAILAVVTLWLTVA